MIFRILFVKLSQEEVPWSLHNNFNIVCKNESRVSTEEFMQHLEYCL